MNVVALRTLKKFWRLHPEAEAPVKAWYGIASKAEWTSPAEIKEQFGANVDFLKDDRLVFDIGGNKYRLVVRVSYTFKAVMIKFIGTHVEYDKIDAETV